MDHDVDLLLLSDQGGHRSVVGHVQMHHFDVLGWTFAGLARRKSDRDHTSTEPCECRSCGRPNPTCSTSDHYGSILEQITAKHVAPRRWYRFGHESSSFT